MVFLGSSPFQAPAIYNLMSVLDFKSGVFYPKRGMYALVESLVRLGSSLGVTYHYNSEVDSIRVENDRATGITLADGTAHEADVVVSNADLYFTETKLLSDTHQSYPESYWKKRQPGPSALLLYLGVKGALPQLEHHNLLFVNDWRENFEAIYQSRTVPESASIYICNPTKTDKSLAPKNHENIFVLVPLPAGLSLDAAAEKRLTKRFVAQIGTMINEPDFASRIISQSKFGPDDFLTEFYSWQSGALGGQSHLLSQSALFRTPNKSKKVASLYYVGAGTTPGIGLPMCLISAQLAYKRIVGDKSGGPVESIEELA